MASVDPEELQRLLDEERAKTAALQAENTRLKANMTKLIADTEAEEELISNQLIKRLEAIKAEKEQLAMAVDREEEFLTNTLQKKLLQVQKEKQDLENKLEAEQEFLVNKLQKQMAAMQSENSMLERKLAADETAIMELQQRLEESTDARTRTAAMVEREKKQLGQLLEEKADLGSQLRQVEAEKATLEQKLQLETFELLEHLNASISRLQSSASEDQMSILDRMVAEIGSLKSRHSEFQAEWTQFKERNDALQGQLASLKDENFVLHQQLDEERSRASSVRLEAARLQNDLEAGSERSFMSRSRGGSSVTDDVSASPSDRRPAVDAHVVSLPLEVVVGGGLSGSGSCGGAGAGASSISGGANSSGPASHAGTTGAPAVVTAPILPAPELSPSRRPRTNTPGAFLSTTPLSEQVAPQSSGAVGFNRTSSFSRTLTASPNEGDFGDDESCDPAPGAGAVAAAGPPPPPSGPGC